jgi:hypothetical protein
LFGTALFEIQGGQPQLPPNGARPPLQANVPCETQPAIKSLAAGTAPGPTPVSVP